MTIRKFTENKDGSWQAPDIDPGDLLDYELDFVDSLGVDNVQSATWSIVPADGLTIVTARNSVSGTKATVWLQDAVEGVETTVTAHITSVQGRKLDRSFKIKCRQL
jgi:hypothetical protein